ncbi:Putative F0F1-ATPase subunit Ca2+/Mg2+ transporter [Gracilibacillus ureilyticus]|uniref:Putative F0F1-ATPase subunit Ca2+/Mg2+ transporter n=1 Tax=Gracilibacillus ureilyticus TaxID=531814 RepID=A0A1H9UP78_9BACI|nr:AtpZ/AtpI family protein [Gracilibacillus ureilyticus]SES11111.1 Putative F0F1-ATPase subunit Ca2+/Mg2+ transporter [Gracilibacillus ureilyticus]
MTTPDRKKPYQGFAVYSRIISQLAGAPLVGLLIGRWLDKQFSTTPLLLVIGLLLGLGAGLYGTIHFVQDLTGDED